MTTSDATLKSRRTGVRRVFLATTAITGLGVALAFAPGVSLKPQAGYPAAVAQNLSDKARKATAPVGFADIVEQVKPAVIAVRVKVNGNAQASRSDSDDLPPGLREFFRRFGAPDMPNMPRRNNRVTGQGSGFFISADGYAVTNNHVVDNAESVEVQADDGKTYTAKVIGADSRTDLALIKIDGDSFPYVRLADKAPRIGDWVLAVGNPFGLGGTVTAGIVSARGRDIGAGPYDDFIQIDAPVNKGNSGGPTFDTEGNVIGVNTAIFSPSGGSVGIAFAIPASTVKSVVEQLRTSGAVTRGWIGVQIQPVTKDLADGLGLKSTKGALVSEPQDNSPAVKAGIKAGDVITAVNGDEVKDSRDLARKIGAMTPNSTVKLTVVRSGSTQTVPVTLGELPGAKEQKAASADAGDANADIGRLGLTLAPASRVAGSGGEGVAVTAVDPSGAAAERGFAAGDIILEVAGKAVSSPSDVRTEIAAARKDGKAAVLMRVKKGNTARFVAMPIKRG